MTFIWTFLILWFFVYNPSTSFFEPYIQNNCLNENDRTYQISLWFLKFRTLDESKDFVVPCVWNYWTSTYIYISTLIWAASWENQFYAYAKTKMQISCAVTTQLISAFVFATRIEQSLLFLNPKFQASSHFLRLCRLVCVNSGRKYWRPVFSSRGSFYDHFGEKKTSSIIDSQWRTKKWNYTIGGTHQLCNNIICNKIHKSSLQAKEAEQEVWYFQQRYQGYLK